MQPQTLHRIFFLFVAMQSVLPPEGISIRYAYACPFNGGKQAKKEYRLRKKNTHYLQRCFAAQDRMDVVKC